MMSFSTLPLLFSVTKLVPRVAKKRTEFVKACSNVPMPITTTSVVVDGGIQRRTANFHPSLWGDYFLSYDSDVTATDVTMEDQREQLKEKVRGMLMAADKPSQKFNLIDAVQRLGVAYHFQTEIAAVLQDLYKTYHQHDFEKPNDENLYDVALLFRLLRQEGYPISCDIFKKFTDNRGKFQESLIDDVRGMLSLYEAAHLRAHGEDILDEALDFTTTHLNSALPTLGNTNPIARQVVHALNQPIHKGLTRLESRQFITFYEQDDSHHKVLLDFAKLDFNLLQKLHQKELSEMTRWYNDLDFARNWPFARDRLVELYFWSVAVYFEPQYAFGRRIISKVNVLLSIIDDIYDAYGTLEELALFTDAIDRWEYAALEQLPEYMQLCYQAILDVYHMIYEEMAKEGRLYCADYAKYAMQDAVRAHFQEAKWSLEGSVPSMEEYMRVALVTVEVRYLAIASFVGMGNLVNKEVFEWISTDPNLFIQSASVVCRLKDDMVSHKFEQERGDVASAVECYMNEHGATEEEVLLEFEKRVTNAWKDMNAECLHPTAIPMDILKRILTWPRSAHVVYTGEDAYTFSGEKFKNIIKSMFVDSVPI